MYKLMSNQAKTPTRVRVAFVEYQTKKDVMKDKKRLKGQKELFLSDDHTQYRAKLAYLAHFLAKGHIAQTWTFDSKVFVKINSNDWPRKILRSQDIARLEIEDEY